MKTLWALPVASTALLGAGPVFDQRRGREVTLSFSYEGEADEIRAVTLVFEGTEAFKCSYYRARSASVLVAYDKLVELGSTPWLEELAANLKRNGDDASSLVHMMIDFDDGPTYEIVCRSFRVDEYVEGSTGSS
jgi:hypothetical protein